MRRILTMDDYMMDDGLDFLRRQLEFIEPEVYKVLYRDIVYPQMIPVSTAAGPFANAITYQSMDRRMAARFMAVGSDDMPLADISRERTTMPVEHAGLGFRYALQELAEAQFMGIPLDQERANSVRRGVEEFAQNIAFLGDADHNLPGFLNNAGIPAASAPTGTWSTATADQIIADVNFGLTEVWDESATVHLPDTVAIPPAQFALLSTTLVGTEHNRSLLDVLNTSNVYYARTKQPLNIMPLAELEGIGAGSTDRMVVYEKNRRNLEFFFPMPLQFIAPQPVGLNVLVPGQFRVSGTAVRYPGAARFVDGL